MVTSNVPSVTTTEVAAPAATGLVATSVVLLKATLRVGMVISSRVNNPSSMQPKKKISHSRRSGYGVNSMRNLYLKCLSTGHYPAYQQRTLVPVPGSR